MTTKTLTVQKLHCTYLGCREPAAPRVDLCVEHGEQLAAAVKAIPRPSALLSRRPVLRVVRSADDASGG